MHDREKSSRLDTILAAWREVLGMPGITSDENFFDSGGSSLLAVRLASRLSRLGIKQVTAADIFSHPSPRALDAWMAGASAGPDRAALEERAARQRRIFAGGQAAHPAGERGR